MVGHWGAPAGRYEKVGVQDCWEDVAETGDSHCEQIDAESDNSILQRGQNICPPFSGCDSMLVSSLDDNQNVLYHYVALLQL